MKIDRERWVVFRKSDNKIFCGSTRHQEWLDPTDLGSAKVVTYRSEKKALFSVIAILGCPLDQIRAEKVHEILVSFDEK